MHYVNVVIDFVERASVFVGSICMLLIMLLTTYNLFARQIIARYTIPSLYELTQDYFMVGLVFLTISYVYARGGHIRVDLVARFIPSSVSVFLSALFKIITIVLFAVIAAQAWNTAVEDYQYNVLSNSSLAYPLGPARMMVAIGSALLCLRVLCSLVKSIGHRGRGDIDDPVNERLPH